MKRIFPALAAVIVLVGLMPAWAQPDDPAGPGLDPSQVEIIAVEPRRSEVKPIVRSVAIPNGDHARDRASAGKPAAPAASPVDLAGRRAPSRIAGGT